MCLCFMFDWCTKTTIDHRLLKFLPRFYWKTPCTGQGWHRLRQWLKRVRQDVTRCQAMDFSGAVHRPTIGIQIHGSDHGHHLRSFPGRIALSLDISFMAMLAMPTWVTCLWGVSCSKTSSVLTFSQILRLSEPTRLNEANVSWKVLACAYHISTLHVPKHDALVMWHVFWLMTRLQAGTDPTNMIDELATLQHWQVAVRVKRCMWNESNKSNLCHWTEAKKKKKFPTDKVEHRAGGWK